GLIPGGAQMAHLTPRLTRHASLSVHGVLVATLHIHHPIQTPYFLLTESCPWPIADLVQSQPTIHDESRAYRPRLTALFSHAARHPDQYHPRCPLGQPQTVVDSSVGQFVTLGTATRWPDTPQHRHVLSSGSCQWGRTETAGHWYPPHHQPSLATAAYWQPNSSHGCHCGATTPDFSTVVSAKTDARTLTVQC